MKSMLGTGRDTREKSRPYSRLRIKKVLHLSSYPFLLFLQRACTLTPALQTPTASFPCSTRQAFRLQNPTQWDLYHTRRKVVASQHAQSSARDSVGTADSTNSVKTLTLESMLKFYGNDTERLGRHGLMREANETYLFHGTKVCGVLFRETVDIKCCLTHVAIAIFYHKPVRTVSATFRLR